MQASRARDPRSPRRPRDLGGDTRDLGQSLREPRLDLAAEGRSRLRLAFDHPAEHRDDVGAFDLASTRSRQLGICEAQDADAAMRIQAGADFFEMFAQALFDRPSAFALCVLRHYQRCDLFALRDLQSDDGQFLEVSRMAVDLFELVDIDVVAAGVDDHVLGAADDEQPPIAIETTEVAGMKPAFLQDFVGGGLVMVITDHHVGAARDDLADVATVLCVELDLDAA